MFYLENSFNAVPEEAFAALRSNAQLSVSRNKRVPMLAEL